MPAIRPYISAVKIDFAKHPVLLKRFLEDEGITLVVKQQDESDQKQLPEQATIDAEAGTITVTVANRTSKNLNRLRLVCLMPYAQYDGDRAVNIGESLIVRQTMGKVETKSGANGLVSVLVPQLREGVSVPVAVLSKGKLTDTRTGLTDAWRKLQHVPLLGEFRLNLSMPAQANQRMTHLYIYIGAAGVPIP